MHATRNTARAMRTSVGAVAAACAVLLAGCGGDETAAVGGPSAATLAPASAPLFASIDSDTSSDQWQQVDELLQRFPGRDRIVSELRSALSEQGVTTEDIDRAFGPTVDVVALDLDANGDGAGVALTQTDDVAALEALLAKDDTDQWVTERLEDGWVAFSDEQSSIDRLKASSSGASLADEQSFADAMAKLPGEALAKVYVNGEALRGALKSLGGVTGLAQGGGALRTASAAVVAEDDGLRLQFFTTTDGSADAPDVGKLLEDVPEGVIAFADFGLGGSATQLEDALNAQPGAKEALGGFEQLVGVSVDDLVALFGQEAVLYVRPGVLIPEVTLVVKTDGTRGRETVDSLLGAAARLAGGQTRTTQVDGLDATEASLGPVSLYAVSYDDRVVVSTSKQGIEDYRGDGDKLADDDRYRAALDAADVGKGDDVFLYVDVDEAFGLAERLAQLGEQPLPNHLRDNVEPLRALVVSGTVDGDEAQGAVFLSLD